MNSKSRSLSETEAAELNQRIPENFSDFLRFREGQSIYEGPLRLPALPPDGHATVLGDFHCDGILEVPEEATLVVTGRLAAEGIIADGNIIVLGEIEAGDIFGESYSNRVFGCGGNARVRCLIEHGHDFEFEGSLDAVLVVSLINVVRVAKEIRAPHVFLNGSRDRSYRKLLAAELFDDEGRLRGDLVSHRIWKKQSLLT